MSMLTRLIGEPEEINGDERCPSYLYRWHLLSTRWFKAYLHHFVADDWSLDYHDHPKRFLSIGLWGWYIEERPDGSETVYRAPWVRTFPATHAHRLRVPSKNCWTLVVVFKAVRSWGFWHYGRFIPWRDYVTGSERAVADARKACSDE